MTVLDIALLLLLAGFVIRGIFRGFLLEVMDVAALVAGYFAARLFGPAVGSGLAEITAIERGWAGLIATVVIFIVTVLATRWLARGLKKVIHASLLGGLDRTLGGLLGAVKALLLALALLFIATMGPWGRTVAAYAEQGRISRVVLLGTGVVRGWIGSEPIAPTIAFGEWLRAAGVEDEVVSIITDSPELFEAILERAREVEAKVPVDDILEGEPALRLPDSFHLDADTQQRLVEILESSSETVKARAVQFWRALDEAREARE